MKKKILASMLSAVMALTFMPAAAFAETSDGSGSDGTTIDEIADQVNDPTNDPFNYRTRKTALKSGASKNYPEEYDLRDQNMVTPVKFQNPFGTCWGFAAIAAAESSILGSDPEVRGDFTADTLDLSEKHLVYFISQPINDPKNPQNGEGTHVDKGVTLADQLNGGGLPFMATAQFASGMGPVVEDDGTEENTLQYMGKDRSIEYQMAAGHMIEYCYDDEDDWSLPEDWRYIQTFVLKESYMLPSPAVSDSDTGEYTYNPDGTAAIKRMLMEHRAVQIGFCADTSSPSQEMGDGQYISKNWAHYTYDATEYPNHAVTIVGWDDNYPKENFVEGHNPPADGAWLVKNSWGSEEEEFPNKGPGWGLENEQGEHTGYFWLSYYDKTINMPEALSFDRNHQSENEGYYIDAHDFMPVNDVEGATLDGETKMANVFKARECEMLEGVSCQTSVPGTKVVSEIYLLPDKFTDPTDGLLVGSVEDEFEFGGFHKTSLSVPVRVQKGQYYAVVQTQKTPDGEYSVNMPMATNEIFAKAMGEKTWVEGVVNKKESYIYTDGKWNDYADKEFAEDLFGDMYYFLSYDNFPIKGYSRMQPDISMRVSGNTVFEMDTDAQESVLYVSFKGHDPSGVTSDIDWQLSEGGSDYFTVTPDPNNPFRATVKAKAIGKANLYVTVDGVGTTIIPLSVKKKELTSIMVDDDGLVYTGKALKPPVVVSDVDDVEIGKEHYTLKYVNNKKCGRGTVIATAKPDDPVYTGSVDCDFTILPAKAVIKNMQVGKKKLTVVVKDQKASGVTAYQVRYRVKGTSSWKKKTFKATSNKLVLKNLKNGKKYQVKVRGKAPDPEDFDFEIVGAFSKVNTSAKIGDVPKKPVISSMKTGKAKLTVTLKGKKEAKVTKYKVQYRIKGAKKWKAKTYKAAGNKIVIKKLKKGKRYQVRVRAVRKDGQYSAYSKVRISRKIR